MRDNKFESAGRDRRILSLSRLIGYLFALMLIAVMGMAMIPNQFFVVSTRAIVNAPVQLIASPIYGRVDTIALQVGQVVNPGDVTATVSNPNQDQTSLTGLRLEKLDLAEKLNNQKSVLDQRKAQLAIVVAQIEDVKRGVLSELSAVIDNSQSTVQSYQAKLSEQDALLQRQNVMVKKGMVSDTSVEPQRQKRNAAQYDLDAARGELRRNEIVRSLVQENIYTGGPVAGNLLTLEMQRTKISGEIDEDEVEVNQMVVRQHQVDNLIAREEGRLGNTGAANVVAQHRGQVVSVDASYGDFLVQGQPVARSLDCSEAFTAAVYESRDVANLDIGTPAMLNFRSLGIKRSAHVYKIVRYFNSGTESRYFSKFPKADGNEVYVLLKLDDPASDGETTTAQSDDKFFGCHVGEEIIVSLGESIVSKLTRYSQQAIAMLTPSSETMLSASTLFDKVAHHGSNLEKATDR